MSPAPMLSRAAIPSVAALHEALPKSVHVLETWRSWLGLARTLGLIALGEWSLSHVSIHAGRSLAWELPWLFVSWAIVASGMVGLFVLGHDCGHLAFSRNRLVNDIVGYVCVSWFFTSFEAWRLGHNHHHARTQLRGDDPDWPEQMVTRDEWARAGRLERLRVRLAYGSPVGLAVGFLVGTVRRSFMRIAYPQVRVGPRLARRLVVSNLVMIAASFGTSAVLAAHFGVLALCKYYLVPTWFGMCLGSLFTFLHHAAPGAPVFDRASWHASSAQVAATFDVRFPRWFEALFFNINRHVAHHVAPRVPWYHLPKATEALQAVTPGIGQEHPFSVARIRATWRAPLLVAEGDALVMAASFDQESS